jgi:hypothetical protein
MGPKGAEGGREMTDNQGWKAALQKALHEPNAVGWIGLFVLVIAVGVGALYFTGPRPHPAEPPTVVSHVVR